MSKIKIFLGEVDAMAPKITNQKSKFDQVESTISYALRSLDPKILARKNIIGQFSSIQNQLKEIDADLVKVKKFITTSVDEYEKAERKISKAASDVGTRKKVDTQNPLMQTLKLYPGNVLKFSLEGKYLRDLIENSNLELCKEIDGEKGINGQSLYDWISTYGSTVLLGIAKSLDPDNKYFTIGDMTFKLTRENGKVVIKGINATLKNTKGSHAYTKYRNILTNAFKTESGEYSQRFVSRLLDKDGIPLYSKGIIANNYKKFSNEAFDLFEDFPRMKKLTLLEYPPTIVKQFGKKIVTAVDGMYNDFNFKGANLAQGASKVFGIAGTFLTVGTNVKTAFFSDEYEGYSIDQKMRRFKYNTAIDVIAGSTATAAGATVGSLFFPPVGTVLGVGVAVSASFLLNHKFKFLGGDSFVDKAKSFTDNSLSKVEKKSQELKKDIGKKLKEVFW